GEYIDIFNGTICCMRLKAPDGKLFFSNNVNEQHGPNGEVWLGVNLVLTEYRFSYIWSNIAPSHFLCPTSFSLCNLLPEYRYHTANLITNQLQCYLCPIISDLLQRWKDGIKVPIESCLNGMSLLVRVVLVAIFCDKPATHIRKKGLCPKWIYVSICACSSTISP
ncbi:hypothetical protein PAXRUDRAFT_154813, partial [Paxillus rubicundulus Ve08.2h10]